MVAARLLIAEDDAAVAAMLAELLRDFGYEVAVASSEKQALQAAAAFRPEVVLVGIDGWGNFAPGWRTAAVLARLLPCAHLVMLATYDRAVAEVGVTERGRLFRAALLKPFLVDQLVDLVARLCANTYPSANPVDAAHQGEHSR